MTETAVLDEPRIQAPPASTTSERPVAPDIPVRRPKRLFANLRFNALRYLVLVAALAGVWGLVRGSVLWAGPGSPEGTFMLVLAGGLLAVAGKSTIDILEWAAQARQAMHVERVRAVQRVFQRAGSVREQALLDWRRIHTVLVDSLSGESKEIRLFHDHDETDRQAEALFRRALSEEVWIRVDGVDAVRRFKAAIGGLDYDALATEGEFLAAFHIRMDVLRRDLALAAIGIRLD